MKKQLLSATLAAISLGLSAVSMAQMGPGPIDSAANAMPQCSGMTGNARDSCLRQPTARIPSLSESAPPRVTGSTLSGTSGIGSTPGMGGMGSSIGGGSSLTGAPRQ